MITRSRFSQFATSEKMTTTDCCRLESLSPNKSLQLTARSAAAFWIPSALRAPASTELRR
jgi:hypothetical protein